MQPAQFTLFVSTSSHYTRGDRLAIAIDRVGYDSAYQDLVTDGYKPLASCIMQAPEEIIGLIVDMFKAGPLMQQWPKIVYNVELHPLGAFVFESTTNLYRDKDIDSIAKAIIDFVASEPAPTFTEPTPEPTPEPEPPAVVEPIESKTLLELVQSYTSPTDVHLLKDALTRAANDILQYAGDIERYNHQIAEQDANDTPLQAALGRVAALEAELAAARDDLENIQAKRDETSTWRKLKRHTAEHLGNSQRILQTALTNLYDLGEIGKPSHVELGNGYYAKIAHAQPRIIDDATLWERLNDNNRRLFKISKVTRTQARLIDGRNANDWLRSMQSFLAGIVEYPAVTMTTKGSVLETGLFAEDSKE